jgi:hypothetical protein
VTDFSGSLSAMEVHFTPEQEAQLAQLASKVGIDAERLVKNVVLRLLGDDPNIQTTASELPIWRLGAVGPFHRRDLYNDVP